MTVLTPVVVAIPFPSGIATASLAGKQLVGVVLTSPLDKSAQVGFDVDMGSGDYRPLMASQPGGGFSEVVVPLRSGSYMQIPDNLRTLPDAIRLRVSGINAAASITLMTL